MRAKRVLKGSTAAGVCLTKSNGEFVMTNKRDYIVDLLDSKIKESVRLEYKSYDFPNGKFGDIDSQSRNKLFQSVCAFANASGGEIIIGVREDNDHNPTEFYNPGVQEQQFEMWEQSFRLSLTSRTRPSLHGVQCEWIPIEDGIACIIISVPNSIQKPHAYNTGAKDDFYVRHGNLTMPMSYDDIKHSFLLFEGTQRKVKEFRDLRVAMLINDEIMDNISNKAGLLLHVIPEWSLNEKNYLDVRKVKDDKNFTLFSPPTNSGLAYYNTDGLMKCYQDETTVHSYIQVFHNAIVEVAEFRLMNFRQNGLINYWLEMEESIAEKLYQYCIGLTEIRIPHGFYLYVTLVNVRDKRAIINRFEQSSPALTRNIIKSNVANWSSEIDYPNAILPLLNTLANAFGLERSSLYDENLNPKMSMFDFVD